MPPLERYDDERRMEEVRDGEPQEQYMRRLGLSPSSSTEGIADALASRVHVTRPNDEDDEDDDTA